MKSVHGSSARPDRVVSGVILFALLVVAAFANAAQVDVLGPPGSAKFGSAVSALPNGNIVVTDPQATVGGSIRAGAVYLYSPTGQLISTLTGSTTNDGVGSQGILVLASGHFVVLSPNWTSGATSRVGAATWVNGSTGLNGAVSSSNSLTGSSTNDTVGLRAIALTNGHYVVLSYLWNGVGAATWADGNIPTSAVVSTANSLYGTTTEDQVGLTATALADGDYVVSSPVWNNGTPKARVGAVTLLDGSQGTGMAVTTANSLHGTTVGDRVGVKGVVALTNGHYVVNSDYWNNGVPGTVAGAITWGNGAGGTVGPVTTSNSLHGVSVDDSIGMGGVVALDDGNYVVASPAWANQQGAATWGNGANGSTTGAITGANSLVGSLAGDRVGNKVDALTGGAYVVTSLSWNNTRGAATWCNVGGCTGTVSESNSFTGSGSGEDLFAYALADGNYVVRNSLWSGTAYRVGAVTWGDGSSGLYGQANTSNSLIGDAENDRVGSLGAISVANGNYVVSSDNWNNDANVRVGAITLVYGGAAHAGYVSERNSLVGTPSSSLSGLISATSDGNYIVFSPNWRNGVIADAGVVVLASGRYRQVGQIESWNSVRGGVAAGGGSMVYSYDPLHKQLVVGLPAENKVALFTMDQVFADNLEP